MLDESKINVDKNLLQHIKENVFPRYEKFYSHDMRHIERVIETITMLARYFNLDENMAFTIASYHDVGLSIDRKHHEITSGQALANDEKLREFFTEEQIETMREAVEDHRGSRVERPRNIYGEILSDADRDFNIQTLARRTLATAIKESPGLTFEKYFEKCRSLLEKREGTFRLWTKCPKLMWQMEECKRDFLSTIYAHQVHLMEWDIMTRSGVVEKIQDGEYTDF